MIFTTVYVSTATRPLGEEDLATILEASRRNNAAADVTGMLLYDEGRIMQLLEGPEENVRRLYDRIAGDPRHHEVVTVFEGAADERQFPSWTMGFRRASASELAGTQGLSDFLDRPPSVADLGKSPTMGQELLAMFRQLG